MSNTNGIISAPIDVKDDVAYILGRTTGDVGHLCDDTDDPVAGDVGGKINKWAKYKPVVNSLLDTTGQLDPNTGDWADDSDWWKGSVLSHICGFSIPQYATLSDIIGTDDIWEYIKPSGTNWKRLYDFHHYNHRAAIPFTLRLPVSTKTTGGTDGGRLVVKTQAQLRPYNLLLSDFANFSSYYFGLIVVRNTSSGTQAYIKTTTLSLSEGGSGELVSLQGCPLITTEGEAEVYGVLAPSAQTEWTSVYERRIWSLNCDDGYGHGTLSIVDPADNVYRIVLSGFTSIADLRVWRRGVITCQLTGGDIVGSIIRNGNMSKSYDLSSVTWKVVKNSDPDTIVREGTLSSLTDVYQTYLERLDETPGSSTVFRAPYVVGTLPALQDPTDYYIITYTYNYI